MGRIQEPRVKQPEPTEKPAEPVQATQVVPEYTKDHDELPTVRKLEKLPSRFGVARPEFKRDELKTNKLDLPSYFHYYDWKTLNVRPLLFRDLERNAEALATKNEKIILDIVQDCIDQPLHEMLFGDMQFILYWIRLNSYTRTPLVVTWKCPNCVARYMLANKIEALEEVPATEMVKFESVTRIFKSDLKISESEEPIDFGSPDLDWPRMSCYLGYQAFIREYPDQAELATAALFVRGDTFEDKLKKLQEVEGLELYEMARNASIVCADRIGVDERVPVKCLKEGCGAKHSARLNADLLTFLGTG